MEVPALRIPIMKKLLAIYTIDFREYKTFLVLIFTLFVGIAGFANLVTTEEKKLSDALFGIDFGRKRSCITNLDSDLATPFRLKRSHVDNNAASGISALT